MSHHIYQTTGFVLGSFSTGEADCFISLLTNDLGVVSAMAKSVRNIRSKLRYSLQEGSYSRIALVRGKEIWRITDAEEIARISPVEDFGKVRVFSAISALVRRFVHGEERDEILFEIVHDIFFFLKENHLSEEELSDTEILAGLRILAALGYVDIESSKWIELRGTQKMSLETLQAFKPFRSQAIKKIREAIQNSHM